MTTPFRTKQIPIPNGDFADGEAGWTIDKTRGEVGVVRLPEEGGKPVLRIVTSPAAGGAKIESARVPCRGPGLLELHGSVRAFSGRHLGLWVREYEAAGNLLPCSQKNWGELGGTGGQWSEGLLIGQVILNPATVEVQLFFLAYPRENERIDIHLGKLWFVRVMPPIPPYAGQYKQRLGESARLTAADVAGPDGIVYPNWTQVGIPGGVPDVPAAVRLADDGVKAGDEISGALDRACRAVGARGGGAVLIGEGDFFMDRPVVIRDSGVVIRGAGRDRTRLVFRYAVGQPGTDAGFYWPPEDGAAVGPDTQVEIHAYPIQLKRLALFRDGQAVKALGMDGGWSCKLIVSGAEIANGASGPVTLRVEAEYADGHKAVAERRVRFVREPQAEKAGPPIRALLYFKGFGIEDREYRLEEDGKRGDTEAVLRETGGLKAGDKIELHAPGTRRFQEQIQHLQGGDDWKRIGFFEILAIRGNRLILNQPLRIDFPVVDGSYGRRIVPIERCGVEDLAIEHLSRMPVTAIEFDWCWEGWVRRVKVLNTGCNGVYAERSKRIEIRDCELDGAWNFDGGQAYAGFTSCADCLFEDNVVRKYRHGPVMQYGTMGCVFRNSLFEGSDLQWHAGWSTENLIENCVIRSRRGTGSYGHAAYATGSDDPGHGPNGPRNVVYHCDLSGQTDGVVLHGVNENWIFAHNRIEVEKGAGFVFRCGCFDHIIRHNAVSLRDRESPLLNLKTPDCVGIDLLDNTVAGGSGVIVEGAAAPALDRGNRAVPLEGSGPERPAADPPSIYAWQKRRCRGRP